MELADLLHKYKNGRTVREKRRSYETHHGRIGEIHGTSLGGATKRGTNRPYLNVNVKWNDGTESTAHSSAFEVEGFDY